LDLEQNDAKRLDGQAIRLIGKAIKEEDARSKLPWLRYVALCSPLLGQQLREIQSVARRFELVELEHNAFADVSDYVGPAQGRAQVGV
jgi:alkylated DNA nucleotide flippase Atl1